ncbi:CD247 antigen like isoform X2 [Myripristis murdjan]|uniref:CD247 antigen like isoform X2 n=1 Tax=Myripristis murdjan TaxID=586833 RepID=UPI001175EE57|nr:T-cell surface glycoprotein CD3 zeta chain-like isoform X2 [Myripristis murdjan]
MEWVEDKYCCTEAIISQHFNGKGEELKHREETRNYLPGRRKRRRRTRRGDTMSPVKTAGVVVLLVSFCLVSSTEAFLTEPVICYILDGFLVIYCLVITGFLFKEKFSNLGDSVHDEQETNGGIYQELQRPPGTDVYQVLETKGKKKTGRKKKAQVNESERNGREMDAYESLTPDASAPCPSPQ